MLEASKFAACASIVNNDKMIDFQSIVDFVQDHSLTSANLRKTYNVVRYNWDKLMFILKYDGGEKAQGENSSTRIGPNQVSLAPILAMRLF